MNARLPVRPQWCDATCRGLLLSVGLLLATAPQAFAQQIDVTHGPAPDGWTLDDSFGLTFEKRVAYNTFATVRISSNGVRDNTLDEFRARWLSDEVGRLSPSAIILADESEVSPQISAETTQIDGRRTFVITYAFSYPPFEYPIGYGGVAQEAGKTFITQRYNISIGPLAGVDNWTYDAEVIINANSDSVGDYDGWAQQSLREAESIMQSLRFSGGDAGLGADGATAPPTDPGDEPIPWELIVGVGALAGALVAAARRLARNAKARKEAAPSPAAGPPKKRRRKDRDKPVGYILQLSSDHLTLQSDTPATLTATAWRVDAEGAHHHAPEARIRIIVPPTLAKTVRVAPAEGTGQLACRITLAEEGPVDPTPLQVTASAPGGSTSAQVLVEAEAAYTIEFF